MQGYDPNFLNNIVIPLPTFSAELEGFLLRQNGLRNEVILDYPHYSLVMNRDRTKRSLFFSAFNIDQNKFIPSERTNKWRLDSRINSSDQLGDIYYKNNPWDRGHSVRNATASFGDTPREAALNARETFYYTNATLQHENLNQDEWLALEDWVKELDLDLDGRLTEFSGPFYGDFSRSIQPGGVEIALTPAGYFKIICFVNKQFNLETRAFVLYQDEQSLKDKNGKKVYNNQNYQVTITEVEELTGLQFPSIIAESNPLIFHRSSAANRPDIITPERHEIGGAEDLVANELRTIELDDSIDIFIASALLKPHPGELPWVSIINFEAEPWDLNGWQIGAQQNNRFAINFSQGAPGLVYPGETVKVTFPADYPPLDLGPGAIYVWDAQGRRIDRVNYTQLMLNKNRTGTPVAFLSPRDVLLEV